MILVPYLPSVKLLMTYIFITYLTTAKVIIFFSYIRKQMSIFRKKTLEKARLLQVVDMSYSQKFLHYYSCTTRTKAQQVRHVKMTSCRRRFDVMTLHRRRHDVISTLMRSHRHHFDDMCLVRDF